MLTNRGPRIETCGTAVEIVFHFLNLSPIFIVYLKNSFGLKLKRFYRNHRILFYTGGCNVACQTLLGSPLQLLQLDFLFFSIYSNVPVPRLCWVICIYGSLLKILIVWAT